MENGRYIIRPTKQKNIYLEKRNMILTNNMRRVIRYIQKQRIPGNDVSPNLVNWIANEIGVTNLTSEQVVYISDNFI